MSSKHSELVALIRRGFDGGLGKRQVEASDALEELVEQLEAAEGKLEIARSIETGRLAVRVDRAERDLATAREALERIATDARSAYGIAEQGGAREMARDALRSLGEKA